MSTPLLIEPPADFADPRLQPDFAAEHWPLCNGEPAPAPDAADLHDRRCIEFLAYFYRLNILNCQLFVARSTNASNERIKSLLDQIGSVTKSLEATEDRYAPIGFFGEPVMDGIKYGNVTFLRAKCTGLYSQLLPSSSHIAIPGLEEIPKSEFRGPARLMRFTNGKMDF